MIEYSLGLNLITPKRLADVKKAHLIGVFMKAHRKRRQERPKAEMKERLTAEQIVIKILVLTLLIIAAIKLVLIELHF